VPPIISVALRHGLLRQKSPSSANKAIQPRSARSKIWSELKKLGLRLSNGQPSPTGNIAQHSMANEAKRTVQYVGPRQKFQNWCAAEGKLAYFALQPHVVRHVVQTSCQRIGCRLLSSGGCIDFGQVQVKLSLAPAAADGRMAQPLRVRPLALGVGQTQAKIGKVKRIFGVALRSCLLYTSPSPRDPSTSRMPSSA